jgi:hypothetical protein
LSASNGIQDSTGNLLLGGGTVNYTTTTTGPTSVDTTSPTGNITLPLAEERVFGTLSFSATAQDVGSFPSGVASVEFWIGESLAAVSTSAPYRANINTAHYANGPTQVSLLVRDHAGNEFAFADTQTIHIQNHALSTLPAAGSPAGTVYNEIPGGRYSLAGLNVRVDRFTVRSAQPIWATSFGSVSRYNGHFHGVAIGDSHSLECTDPSSRVVGIWGRSDTKIHRIGIICKKLDGTDRTEYVGALGGVDGRFFERVCPQDTLVTQLEGSFTNSLNSLRVRCK